MIKKKMVGTVFNLDPILRQIVSAENKKYVRELEGVGMREKKIEQILRGDYYPNIYSLPLFPKAKILECKKYCNTLSRSMIQINALLDDENILDSIKNPLLKELNRLRDLYDDQKWIARLASAKKYSGPGNPKTWKQMVSFQIRSLYEYLRSLNDHLTGQERDYSSKDIFELIRELLSVAWEIKFSSWKQIKSMYENAKRHKGSNPNPMLARSKTKVSRYEQNQIAR